MYHNAAVQDIVIKITELLKEKRPVIIGVDGRCASGKTTLADALSEIIDCNIIHCDHYFLQPFQRTKERYLEPGGNLDRERLITELLTPLLQGRKPLYQPFDCSRMCFGNAIRLTEKDVYIIEGSYSCHPLLCEFYDFTIFVTTDSETQKQRIRERNGEDRLPDFLAKWIPLEEKYFEAFDIESKADIIIKT